MKSITHENILTNKWAGLLRDTKDKAALAVLLQSQSELNKGKRRLECRLGRAEIPLLVRMVNELQNKIPLQTSSEKLFDYKLYGITPFEEIAQREPRSQYNIDTECEWLFTITKEIVDSIVRDFPNGIKLNHIKFAQTSKLGELEADAIIVNCEKI